MVSQENNNNLETEESEKEDVKDDTSKEGEYYEEYIEWKVEKDMITISGTEECEGEVQKDVNKMRKENNQDGDYSENGKDGRESEVKAAKKG